MKKRWIFLLLASIGGIALADGHLSSFELRTISKVANEVGYKKSDIKKFVDQVRFENSIVL